MQETHKRPELIGANVIEDRKRVGAFGLFLNQFRRPHMLILLFATVVSAATKEWIDATIIFYIVLAGALLSFIQEYNANAAVEKLHARVWFEATVLHDGECV